MAAHTAVRHELLTRYLDAWTPTVLHGARQVCYVDGTGAASAEAALRVFAEFADRLAGHELEMVLVGAVTGDLDGVPPGVTISLSSRIPATPAGPVFAYLDAVPDGLRALMRHRASEALIVVDPSGGGRESLLDAGLTQVLDVELVDAAGATQLLLFGTRSAKNLEKFKAELWAVDEYAGIRYRDPRDPDSELLDISATPPIGPLRRALLALVRTEPRTLAELREHTATRTMYRGEDAARAVHSLLTGGTLTRDPVRGRLNAETVLRAA